MSSKPVWLVQNCELQWLSEKPVLFLEKVGAYAQRVDILFHKDSMHYFETAIKKQKKLVTDLSIQSKNYWWLFCLYQEHKLCQPQETDHETIILTINTTDCGIGHHLIPENRHLTEWNIVLGFYHWIWIKKFFSSKCYMGLPTWLCLKKTTTTTWSK